MIRQVIVYTMLAARIVIAARLLQLGNQKARNLLWLAGVFLINAIYVGLGIGLNADDFYLSHLAYTLGLSVAQIFVVMFIHTTFYQGSKSPYLIFLVLSLITGIVDTILALFNGPVITLISVVVTINWGWHIAITYKAYQQIADEKYVEDWVKARYKLMIAYCVLLSTSGLMVIGYLVPNGLAAAQSLVAFFALVGVVVQFLVWVMPERFRQYLNRNYQPEFALDEELVEAV